VKIFVNGETRALPDGTTIESLLEQLDLAPGRRGVAVAVDAEVVPRSGWPDRALHEGDRVEVLTAIQGG
jgi:sulfur carrier protein